MCKYCGAVTIASSMSTYRDNCGCVGSSWECSYCNALNLVSVSSVAEVRKRDGAIEAQRLIRDIFIGETNK